ncbi:MAG: monovalent cation/H+ antiporter subunit A [Proteobacteria bacterium]|nr:monovalent cation/H+ antiporter subunit A [Pseudomonadota bacterium]
MLLGLIVLLPFLGSLAAAFVGPHARNAAAWLAGLTALACVLLLAALFPQVAGGDIVRLDVAWMPRFGLALSFRLDGYAWLFAMLVASMGALVVIYARYYMSPGDSVPRFFSFLLAFMGAMLGTVLSGNLIQLVVFWELTSLTSFMLIAYWYQREDARRGARMALIVTMGGGLSLLLGVLMLGAVVGGYDLDTVLAAGDTIRAHPWYPAVLLLIVAGVLTKSAQFPFHFWLPQAMAAPTPVSAYLHSATLVMAGVFLLARLWPALHGTDLWFWVISGAGGASLLIGAFSATYQRDLKGVLAYSTISHLGLITLLLGMDSPLALVAAVFHMMNHATFKASLFMAAGIIEHETGTRDIKRLRGLRHLMPITATVATVAAAAMAGVPLMNGFLSKEMFFAEAIVAGSASGLRFTFPLMATLAGVFSVAYSLRLIDRVFLGPVAQDLPRMPGEPTRGMLLPSAVLVAACLLVGVLPAQTVGPLLHIAARSILGPALPQYELAVWHGFSAPLLMSLVALSGGVVFYVAQSRRGRTFAPTPLLSRWDAARMFDIVNAVVIRGSGRVAGLLFPSRLQLQVLMIFLAAIVAGMLPLLRTGPGGGNLPLTTFDPSFGLLWLAGAACAIGAAFRAKFHRLAALIMVGGVGLVTCLTFAWFSAPDLALTQVAVEVVTLVLILLGLRWLPERLDSEALRRRTPRARARRARDLVVALIAGGGVSVLTYAVLRRSGAGVLTPFFLKNSLEQAGGRNVVNVMLVDFRGFDTFGEITVVGIVAITVYALLRRFRPAPESMAPTRFESRASAEEMALAHVNDPLPPGEFRIAAVLARPLLPLAGVVSLYLLVRGHHAPGGGFVGGLVMASAVIAQYMLNGTIWVESRLRVHPLNWIGIGLLTAAAAGLSAWAWSLPFLTALTASVHLPLVGEIDLASVLLFDAGVYLLVVGATLLILVALAHQSLRRPRKTVTPVAAPLEDT